MAYPFSNLFNPSMNSQGFSQPPLPNSNNNAYSNNVQYSMFQQPAVAPPIPVPSVPYSSAQYTTPNPLVTCTAQLPLSYNRFSNPSISNAAVPSTTGNQVSNWKPPFLTPPPPFPNLSQLSFKSTNYPSNQGSFVNPNAFRLTQQAQETNRLQQSSVTGNVHPASSQSIPFSMTSHPPVGNIQQTPQSIPVTGSIHHFQSHPTISQSQLQNNGQQYSLNNFPVVPPKNISSNTLTMQSHIACSTSEMLQQAKTPQNSTISALQTVSQTNVNLAQVSQPLNTPYNQVPPKNSNLELQSFNSYGPYDSRNFLTLPNPDFPINISSPAVNQRIIDKSENSDVGLIQNFLTRVKLNSFRKPKVSITIAEFRYCLKVALDILIQLTIKKEALSKLLESDEDTWVKNCNEVKELQDKLTSIVSQFSDKEMISAVLEKLKRIQKKRRKIRERKGYNKWLKQKHQQDRLELHKKYDQWLETLREKDLQDKRETEMKKEADSILSEVRRKIQEAKRVIEKLKIFQKLRQIRKENAVKKGMFVFSKHDKVFEKKVSELKEVMLRQLSDYEDEEKALKVMLETEQEGQLEEEAQWKIKQLKKRQEKKFQNIQECLFGSLEPPLATDPLYFFWQNYNAGNCDINALVKIRHDWDVFLVLPQSNEGSSIPQQWVAPDPPSSEIWAQAVDQDFNKI